MLRGSILRHHSFLLLLAVLHFCQAITKKTELWQIDVVPGAPNSLDHHKSTYNSHSNGHNNGHFSSTSSNGGKDYGSSYSNGIDTSNYWWPPSDCAKGKTDVGFLGPVLALVVGAWIVLPIIAVLALVKVHLFSQLVGGGGGGTPTVTTNVSGKESMARRIDDVWSKLKEAMVRYADSDKKGNGPKT